MTRLARLQALAKTYATHLGTLGQMVEEWKVLGEGGSLPLRVATEKPGRVAVEFLGEKFLVELTLEAQMAPIQPHRGVLTFSRVKNELLDKRVRIAQLRVNTNPDIVDGSTPGFVGETPTQRRTATEILLHWLCLAFESLPPPAQ